MKVFKISFLLIFLFVSCATFGLSDVKSSAGFEKLKTLVGEWQGTTSKKEPVTVSYRLVSGDSALMESIGEANTPSMVSMYHQDGDSLLMTHYCMAKNQPRMRAQGAADGNKLTFSFVDASNLPTPDAGHMQKVTFVFEDNDHFSQEWTWVEKGQEKPEVFRYERKK